GANFTTTGAFSNAGSMTVGPGSTFSLAPGQNYTQTAGGTTLSGGNLAVTTLVDLRGGSLGGSGTITGNVNSAGPVNPGNNGPGLLTITGNYTQTAAGSLNIEIGGLTPGAGFDQLAVSGVATLGGALNVTQVNGFVVQGGESFPVLTYGSRAGDFAV